MIPVFFLIMHLISKNFCKGKKPERTQQNMNSGYFRIVEM